MLQTELLLVDEGEINIDLIENQEIEEKDKINFES